jgi:hypothetical protein
MVPAYAWSQEGTPAPTPQPVNTSSILLAPKSDASATPAQGAVRTERAASQAVSAEISSELATYRPDLYGPNAPAPQDADKPKNQIPRVPPEMMKKYVVHEARPHEFTPLELYTRAGLIDLAFKEHPGLRIGNFFNLNANLAYETIVAEQLAAEKQDTVDTTIAMAVVGDKEEMGAMQDALLDESRQNWWPQRPGENLHIP